MRTYQLQLSIMVKIWFFMWYYVMILWWLFITNAYSIAIMIIYVLFWLFVMTIIYD